MTSGHSERPRDFVVDTSNSPHARLRPVPVSMVDLTDRFWSPRLHTNRETTIRSQYEQCERTGRIDNFRRAAGNPSIAYHGPVYNDSDVYKWLEAAAWTLAADPDPELTNLVDGVIELIAAAQQPDGYLNTAFMFDKADERWTNFDWHEMYCAGHLFQAAVAHNRSTGSTRLLDVATRLADHLCDRFGPAEQGKQVRIDGHPEVEMALVELGRATGNRRYVQQAQFFVDVRGHGVVVEHSRARFSSPYFQDHMPIREMDRMVGHAVRAVYLNAGAADLVAETGQAGLDAALERMWDNLHTRQTYITGGIGAHYEGEALGKDWELPNARAYTETCAAIGSVMWNWRMLALRGEARFADALERALYNGVLAGLSLDGQCYFYQNPLADDGTHRREPWFGTACCPPNLARMLASLPGYFYSVSDAGIWVHLYASGRAHLTLPDGQEVGLTQTTDYPWDGDIRFTVDGAGLFSLFLRIPEWCERGATIEVNAQATAADARPGSYAEIKRTWSRGDTVRLLLPMPVQRLRSHPYVTENKERVALMRGPLVYCVEAAGNASIDPHDLVLADDTPLSTSDEPDLLGGIVVIKAPMQFVGPAPAWNDRLYRAEPIGAEVAPTAVVDVTAIPYYAWANREPGEMQVWLRAVP